MWKRWRFERREGGGGVVVGHTELSEIEVRVVDENWYGIRADCQPLEQQFHPFLISGRVTWGEVDSSYLENGMVPIVISCVSFTTDGRVRLILSRCRAVIGQRSIRLNKLPRPERETTNAWEFSIERDDLWSVVSRAAFPPTTCGKSRRFEVEANKVFGREPAASARNWSMYRGEWKMINITGLNLELAALMQASETSDLHGYSGSTYARTYALSWWLEGFAI